MAYARRRGPNAGLVHLNRKGVHQGPPTLKNRSTATVAYLTGPFPRYLRPRSPALAQSRQSINVLNLTRIAHIPPMRTLSQFVTQI
jgi:hypothetical protein